MASERVRRRRPADERTEQLLDAAESVLLERGLAATTIADVAEAAGVAKGTVYLYFDSKDAILAGLRARHLGRFVAAVNASMSAGRATPPTRLDRFVESLFAFCREHRELHHVLFHQAGFSEEDAFVGVRDVLAALITEGVAAKAFQVADAQLAASYVLHGLHGVLVDAMHGPPSAAGRHLAAARDLARRSLGAADTRQPSRPTSMRAGSA
jgi:TetR/AcrR family transcriptional regulator, transcriptional repressor for nem operon